MKRHKDVEAEKKKLKEGEHDNFPKGAKSTAHSFRKDKKLLSNEDVFKLTDDEILPGDVITPHIEKLGQKCCRAVYHLDKKRLAKIFRVHGEGIELYNIAQDGETVYATNPQGELVEVNIPDDPDYGWDMTNRKDGFPCIALLPNGKCAHHEDGKSDLASSKPRTCKMFPRTSQDLPKIATCSYTFDKETGKIRSGTCDGCLGKLSE